jgi:hypothetical protein
LRLVAACPDRGFARGFPVAGYCGPADYPWQALKVQDNLLVSGVSTWPVKSAGGSGDCGFAAVHRKPGGWPQRCCQALSGSGFSGPVESAAAERQLSRDCWLPA